MDRNDLQKLRRNSMRAQTILIIDSHDASRDIGRTIFEWAGYRVLEADAADRAVELLERNVVDMIVTEVALPRTDGFALVTNLRKDPSFRSLPVLLLTADLTVTAARALAHGCSACLHKPCSPPVMLAEARRLLRRGRGDFAGDGNRTGPGRRELLRSSSFSRPAEAEPVPYLEP